MEIGACLISILLVAVAQGLGRPGKCSFPSREDDNSGQNRHRLALAATSLLCANNTRCRHQAWTRTCRFRNARTVTGHPNCHSLIAIPCCDSWGSLAGTLSWWDCRMGCLPDELWTKILGMGVENQVLDYRDLCSLAFVSRRIQRISSLDCMWRPLWERDQAELGVMSATRSSGAEVGAPRKDDENKNFRALYRVRLFLQFCWFSAWVCVEIRTVRLRWVTSRAT